VTVRDALVETSADDATRDVAGVPLVLRTVLVLQRAGIERVRVAGPAPVPDDARVHISVDRSAAQFDGPHVVVGPGAVVDQALVGAAAAAGVVRWEHDGAWIEVRDVGTGAPVAPPAAAPPHAARPHTEPPRIPPPRAPTSPPIGVLLPAAAPRAHVERALLRALENARDGYLDRLIHRRLSRPTTRLLLRTPLTPNHVTVVGVLIGIAGGVLIGSPSAVGVLAGIAALLVSGVLDCTDGEIARIKLTESRLGHLLDVTGDTLVHVALLAGIARQLARVGSWPGTATFALLALGVAGAFATITWSEQTEGRRHRVPDAWENRVLDGILSPLTTRDWYVFPIAFAVAGRLDLLVSAAAWGAQVFWVTVAVLVWRVSRNVPA
jgi:phosphatidylglycerophosphate synthase